MPRIKGAGGLYGLTEEGIVTSCDGKNCNGTHITHVQGKGEANKKGEALRVAYQVKVSEADNLVSDRSASIELSLLKTQLAEALKKISELEQNLHDLEEEFGYLSDSTSDDSLELEERIEVIEAQCQVQNPKAMYPERATPPKVTELLPGGEELTLHTGDGLSLKVWWLEAAEGVPSRKQAVYLASLPAARQRHSGRVNRAARVTFAKELADRGFHVMLMDYRGSGGNPGIANVTSDIWDVKAAWDTLGEFGFSRKNIIWCECYSPVVTNDGKLFEEYRIKVYNENESGYYVAGKVKDADSIVKIADAVAPATEMNQEA